MINIVFKLIRKIIIAIFMLYGLNILISPMNIIIPINIFSIVVISLLGIPGLLSLVLLFLLI